MTTLRKEGMQARPGSAITRWAEKPHGTRDCTRGNVSGPDQEHHLRTVSDCDSLSIQKNCEKTEKKDACWGVVGDQRGIHDRKNHVDAWATKGDLAFEENPTVQKNTRGSVTTAASRE